MATRRSPQLRFRGRGSRRSYRWAMPLSLEAAQFIQRCEASNSR
ncbi:hypothetical protein LC55x_2074 [Lysobacter capsici]|nr:hypothetical protein LC55x_2074 [Lysobacter capsici]